MSLRAGIGLGSVAPVDLAAEPFFELIEAVEDLGYDSLWLSDSATLGGPAPLPTLAAVAARTRRLKLGTNVLVAPPRNPVLLAKELATVDALSGGRMLPAFGSFLSVTIKDTAIASVIAVPEFMRQSETVQGQTFQPIEVYTFAMLVYFLLLFPVTRGVDLVYRRLAHLGRS